MSGGRPRVPASHGVMSIRSSAGASFAMIDLHYAPTPNGWKISILLEELGLPYTVTPVNIRAGEQFRPEFLASADVDRSHRIGKSEFLQQDGDLPAVGCRCVMQVNHGE